MLQTLKIENIAVIESAEINFEKGFCVLTGETGAGKSILIDSLGAVLGNRTSKELVRNGSDRASVSAVFSECTETVRALLEELGFPCDDDSVLLSRTLTADGKTACRINGLPATTSVVRQISRHLVNIYGQQESHVLTDVAAHISFVDRMAADEKLLTEYRSAYDRLLALEKEKREISVDESEKERRIDMLSYQINEISAANITPGEREELAARKRLLQNSEKIARALSSAYSMLMGDDEYPGAVGLVEKSAEELGECAEFMEEVDQNAQRLSELGYELEGIYDDIRSLADGLEFSPAELAEIEERLDFLYRLSKKYGATEEEILAFCEGAQKELESIEMSQERIEQLDQEIAQARQAAQSLADELTDIRKKTAARMEKAICEELVFLNMPNVEFVVSILHGELSPNGCDRIEFLISANLGEPPKPLSKIASGGELSRTMLAILSVLNDKQAAGTLVFDEIDAGISGRAADKVGQRLRKTAGGHQVICITHLAQIASKSDRHYLIEKSACDGRTVTQVKLLDYEGRVNELARIIGGTVITDSTRNTAREMLANADAPGK